MSYIDREETIKFVKEHKKEFSGFYFVDDVISLLEHANSAGNIKPVTRARWINANEGEHWCSKCGECIEDAVEVELSPYARVYFPITDDDGPSEFVQIKNGSLPKFCPNCGAEMDGGKEGYD